jgi:hypothetical protein
LVGVANLAIFASLSPRVERARIEGERRFVGVQRSAGTVARLSALFALDAFAGGFVVNALVAYRFNLRWGLDAAALGLLFFWVGVVTSVSFLAARWLASRIGLLNTMVVTHLPSNVLLILVPLAPTAWLAVVAFIARMSISQMDVPTRQSYTMAVVEPDERTATAGITNVARSTAAAVSPAFAGWACRLVVPLLTPSRFAAWIHDGHEAVAPCSVFAQGGKFGSRSRPESVELRRYVPVPQIRVAPPQRAPTARLRSWAA